MKTLPVCNGTKADIVAIIEDNGTCPVEEFLSQFQVSERKKVFMLFQMFCLNGELRNTEKFKKEDGNIWCFKSSQIRILCFFQPITTPKRLVLTHGCTKKKDKMDPVELRRAEKYFNQFTR